MVNRLTLTVKLATKHFCGDGHLEHIASELAMGVRVVNISCAFEDLSNKNRVKSLIAKEGENARIPNTPSQIVDFARKYEKV